MKYPEHTFELYHDRRRPYYITADNDEEKQEWMKVMKVCCYRCYGKIIYLLKMLRVFKRGFKARY